MLYISALIFLITIVPLIPLFGIKKFISILLMTYLSFFGLIVFTAEISGFLNRLSSQAFFLFLQTIELVIVWTIWFFNGKPKIFEELIQNFTSPFCIGVLYGHKRTH